MKRRPLGPRMTCQRTLRVFRAVQDPRCAYHGRRRLHLAAPLPLYPRRLSSCTILYMEWILKRRTQRQAYKRRLLSQRTIRLWSQHQYHQPHGIFNMAAIGRPATQLQGWNDQTRTVTCSRGRPTTRLFEEVRRRWNQEKGISRAFE